MVTSASLSLAWDIGLELTSIRNKARSADPVALKGLDTRSSDEVLKTHDNSKFECLKVSNLEDVDYSEVDIVAVDEAQFFSGLKPFVEKVLMDNKTILLAGLDGDYKQEKFGEIIDCIPLADKVFKITAMCMECMDGTHGPFTKRIVDYEGKNLIGGKEMYKAVCRKHL